MRTNLAIAALIYPMIQAVLFGLGILGLLVADAPPRLYPLVIAATFVGSLPFALWIAPRMRSRTWRQRHGAHLRPA
jgi:hypothetical protein